MKCLFCGKENQGSKKYCSLICSQKYWTNKRSNIISGTKCFHCGEEIKRSAHKFCSLKCAKESYANTKNKHIRTKAMDKFKICGICNTEYNLKHKVGRYCSAYCNIIASENKIEIKRPLKKCKCCGIEFNPYTSLNKFCSVNCRIEDQKSKRSSRWSKESCENITGKNNPAYRNGTFARGIKKTSLKERVFITNSKKLKQQMITDGGFVYCQNCGTNNSLRFESHHIIYRSEKPLHEHLHDKINLLVMCIHCHNEFHKHKSLRNDLVIDRKLDVVFGADILEK